MLTVVSKFPHEYKTLVSNLILNELFLAGIRVSPNRDKVLNYMFEYEAMQMLS